jgi:D-amino-acid dehydrogenase
LSQCNDTAFERNVQQLVALGAYSHTALKDVVRATGIEYHRMEHGIAHYYTDQKSFDTAGDAAALMRKYGVSRRIVTREELLRIEPAFNSFADRIVGGTYTASDESGDARVFTQALAQRCKARGAEFVYHHDVVRLNKQGGAIESIAIKANNTPAATQNGLKTLKADHYVVACGSFTAPLLRTVGVDLPIYPGKGYSATLKIKRPDLAPKVSSIDDQMKIAISRLGDELRVAGTIEVGGYDLSLDTPLAKARCQMLSDRIETVFPGLCDTRNEAEGGTPNYWTGLRPATPTNIPYIGQTPVGKLWINAGHGTLGWTHGAGSGKALAELVCGRQPDMNFGFYGNTPRRNPRLAPATAAG